MYNVEIKSMTNKKFKTIRVSLPTHGYLMDNKTRDDTSLDSVIWRMVSQIDELNKEIARLSDKNE